MAGKVRQYDYKEPIKGRIGMKTIKDILTGVWIAALLLFMLSIILITNRKKIMEQNTTAKEQVKYYTSVVFAIMLNTTVYWTVYLISTEYFKGL